jgi:septal ring factor EnvC (AmiA/AmiB activator)
MSTLTKVFVVLVLIISLVYLGVSATLFAHRVDFKDKYESEVAAHNKTKDEAKTDKGKLEADIAAKAKEIQNLAQAAKEAENRASEANREKDAVRADFNKLKGDYTALVAEQSKLQANNDALTQRNDNLNKQLSDEKKLREDAQRVRDTVQAELLASQDRLDKAYKDIAEMEKQIVEVSRAKNEIESELAYLRALVPNLNNVPAEPKIDGTVLGVSNNVNLVLISVGEKDKVQVGYRFTVYRGSTYVSKLVVDRVDDTWAACRELSEFRKEAIQQGDSVSTRVFD